MARELLFSVTKKDLNITYFRGSGAGGQHRNKTDSAVRIQHPDSGAVAECQEQRSQHQNKRIALERLIKTPKFRLWKAKKIHEIDSGKTLEQHVDEAMNEKNIKTEYNENGKWRDETDESIRNNK